MVAFGHLGDGNIHFNLTAPSTMAEADFLAQGARLTRMVHDRAASLGGSISAEHGIGSLKAAKLAHYKSPVALQMMRAIKQALDPQGIMNPGRVLVQCSTLSAT